MRGSQTCYFLTDWMVFTISDIVLKLPPFSIKVPITMASAPAFATSLAVSGLRIPPPTMRNPLKSFLTEAIISGCTLDLAPEPASRYTNLIPMNWAESAYITASPGLSKGIVRTEPTCQTVVPSPMMIYAVGKGSRPNRSTLGAPNACACEIKYGLSEFRSELKRIASAPGTTPVTLPGKRITGILTAFLMLDTVSVMVN